MRHRLHGWVGLADHRRAESVRAGTSAVRASPRLRPAPVLVLHGAVVDEAACPVLFGTAQATWAPIDLRFELLTGKVDPDRIARVYVFRSSVRRAWWWASSMATGASGRRP